MTRIIYFVYYFWKLDTKMFKKFLYYTIQRTGKGAVTICFDVLKASFKYNISLLEYFQFHFYENNELQKIKWAGTGYMYEYQKKMNPPKFRQLLEDKTIFNKNYSSYMKHIVCDVEEVKTNSAKVNLLLSNPSGKIVFKIKDGGCGRRVLVEDANKYTQDSLLKFINDNNYDIVEEFIIQHEVINKLSSNAVNTVRVITQLNRFNEVEILGCRLRISVKGNVDNLAAGNLAASIETKTGIINSNGVYSDITKEDAENHPVTGHVIKGTKIPFWKETIEMVVSAAKINPINRSVGWDVAITPTGPDLIEGNREWCKLLFQLPVKEGLKPLLDIHANF